MDEDAVTATSALAEAATATDSRNLPALPSGIPFFSVFLGQIPSLPDTAHGQVLLGSLDARTID